MLVHIGNDPRVFSLYFTYKTFYTLFRRVVNPVYGGFDKFKDYGWNWVVPLEDLPEKKLQIFYRKMFKGYMVCDFEPLYACMFIYDLGYFRIPVNIVKFCYIVKYDGLKNLDDLSLYVLKKYKLSVGKSNIVSLNEDNVLTDRDPIEMRMNLVVDDKYYVHDDSFIVGIKISTFGVVLTSQFVMGNINFFGISCYASFKMWLKNVRHANMRFLKCCFSYYPFLRKIMAMFQCKRCNKILMRFFDYFFKKNNANAYLLNNFQNFSEKFFYNMKRRSKIIDMSHLFTSKYGYSEVSNLPRPFDHLHNGELIHDCYYDLTDSNQKVLFIEDMNFINRDNYGCMKLACPSLLTEEFDLNIDDRLVNIKLNCEGRSPLYAESVKRTFAFFAIF